MKADILLTNGRLIDPANHIDQIGNIAIKNRRIIPWTEGMESDTVIDAAGCIVCPGLIDFHAHIFELGTDSGLNADIAMLPQGVTMAVDAGSSGVSTYRAMMRQFSQMQINTRFYLHFSATGQCTHQSIEPLFPDRWNMEKYEEAIENAQDNMLGFKLRISKPIVGERGPEIFRNALRVADHFQKPMVVHVTDSYAGAEEIADAMRPGDVFCHVFHGTGNTILDADGHVLPQVRDAQIRGVYMDACHGLVNYSHDVCERALNDGFLPDIISTDLNTRFWNKRIVFGLPYIMSKFLCFGMSVPEIIARVTEYPARAMGLLGAVGTLDQGSSADITVLKVCDKKLRFEDSLGTVRQGSKAIIPLVTILKGSIVYRSSEMWV